MYLLHRYVQVDRQSLHKNKNKNRTTTHTHTHTLSLPAWRVCDGDRAPPPAWWCRRLRERDRALLTASRGAGAAFPPPPDAEALEVFAVAAELVGDGLSEVVTITEGPVAEMLIFAAGAAAAATAVADGA